MEEPLALENGSSELKLGSDDLIIKGQGGANVVVEYKNSKNVAQVIRLRKARLNKEEQLQDTGIDELIWPELLEKGASLLSLQSDILYMKDILSPLIGSQYIPPQELIYFNAEEAQIYGGASQGVLMPDVTLLPPLPLPSSSSPSPMQSQQQPATVCIEIKPKYGSITKCNTVRPDDVHLKHSTSRYQLHQLLKRDQGTIDTVSSYDPLDLFSTSEPERMKKALSSLLENPQNNLSIFINGRPLNLGCGGGGGSDAGSGRGGKTSENLLETAIITAIDAILPKHQHNSDKKDRKAAFMSLLRCILQQEKVLENISKAQQACHMDIEGVYKLYQKMLLENNTHNNNVQEESRLTDLHDGGSEKSNFPKSAQHAQHEEAVANLLKLSQHEAIKILRSYIIATTAKDCSIMITLRSHVGSTDLESSLKNAEGRFQNKNENGLLVYFENWLEGETHNEWIVEYRISVVDLDRKSTSKIPKHYVLDKNIMLAAKKQQKQ